MSRDAAREVSPANTRGPITYIQRSVCDYCHPRRLKTLNLKAVDAFYFKRSGTLRSKARKFEIVRASAAAGCWICNKVFVPHRAYDPGPFETFSLGSCRLSSGIVHLHGPLSHFKVDVVRQTVKIHTTPRVSRRPTGGRLYLVAEHKQNIARMVTPIRQGPLYL
jgi:hypothetical protein